MYEDWEAMKEALGRVSKGIERGALKAVGRPLVFAATGTGRVASGILDVLWILKRIYFKNNIHAFLRMYDFPNS